MEFLTDAERTNVRKIAREQREFHDKIKVKRLANPEELNSLDCRDHNGFATYCANLSQDVRARHESKHKHGWRRWAKSYQAFATVADRFVKDFEPIIQLAQNPGAPDGGMAIGTICFLFAVARNKTNTDVAIEGAISGIQGHLREFDTYQNIYLGNGDRVLELRKRTLLAYCGFVELAMKSAQYYLGSGAQRWFKAVVEPKEIHDLVDQVQESVIEVRASCAELQAINVSEIRKQNEELLRRVEELQLSNDDTRMNELRAILQLPPYSFDTTSLVRYSQSVQAEFAEKRIFETMDDAVLTRCKSERLFQEWSESDGSGMHVIVGEHHPNLAGKMQHCWMSPLACDLACSVHGAASVAAYIFPHTLRTDAVTALADLLSQILEHRKRTLRDVEGFARVRTKFEHLQKRALDRDERVNALEEALALAMALFQPKERLHVVLDRVDMCHKDERRDLLSTLARSMARSPCIVKILVVAEGLSWDIREEDLRRMKPPGMLKISQIVVQQGLASGVY